MCIANFHNTGKVYGCTSQCKKRVFECNTNRWALSGYVMENGKMSIIQYSYGKRVLHVEYMQSY